MTVALIAVNVAVFVFYQVPQLEQSVRRLGFYPCVPEGSCPDVGVAWPVDLFTSMFAHADWLHLAGNMLFLWIFGNNVEDAMGPLRFVVFYALSGLAATALQLWITLSYAAPGDAAIPHVGASGAIAGVLGAYVVLYPFAGVITLFFVVLVEVPAVVFIGFWFLLQLWLGGFSIVSPESGGGVAFFAHIGGFVFGLLAARLFAARRRPRIAGPW